MLRAPRRGQEVRVELSEGSFQATMVSTTGAACYVRLTEGPYDGARMWFHRRDLLRPKGPGPRPADKPRPKAGQQAHCH